MSMKSFLICYRDAFIVKKKNAKRMFIVKKKTVPLAPFIRIRFLS